MRIKNLITWLVVLVLGAGFLSPAQEARASQDRPAPVHAVSAYELIIAMNSLRIAYGYPALIEDPIINAVAQYTAETMAASQLSWHIGDVRGRIAAAGYGGGATVWATENFAVGSMGIDEIMAAWADPDHMRPATTAAYCHIGAGVATASNGKTYYILQAAYASGQACGSTSSSSTGGSTTGSTGGSSSLVSQLMVPVKIAAADADGNVYHVVQAGQSFWSIAIAYQITIADIETWNNLTRDTPLKTGQKLFIPGKNTKGYSTPTPQGMIMRSTPDADGRIVHEVQAYQALLTISEAYTVSVDRILSLNGLQKDWPLQIGQKLMIDPGNVTPSPTLSAIQRLTPEADGNYYHTIQSGETLSWIAAYYDIPLSSLMAWNGLGNDSIIRANQKLLLMVTPPATPTSTPQPPTAMPTAYPTLTASPNPSSATVTPAPESGLPSRGVGVGLIVLILLALAAGVIWLWRQGR